MDKISLFLRQIFANFIVIIAQVFHIGINLYTVFQIQLAVALYEKISLFIRYSRHSIS